MTSLIEPKASELKVADIRINVWLDLESPDLNPHISENLEQFKKDLESLLQNLVMDHKPYLRFETY